MRNGIAIAGTALVDKINEIAIYPNEGNLTQIRSINRAVGGCVPNVGVDLKRIDPTLHIVALCCVGQDDDDGEFLRNKLFENGVDISRISYSTLPTSFTNVMSVQGGQRTFFSYPGACSEFGYEHIDLNELNVKMLHLGYFLLLEKVDQTDGLKILKTAKEQGIITSLDMVSDKDGNCDAVKVCLPYTDHLIINEVEAEMLCGMKVTSNNLCSVTKKLKDMGIRGRVVVHMPEMCACMDENDHFTILPSYDLPNHFIKGTTGAGDAFCAGALLGIYRGLPAEDMLTLASMAAVAALTASDGIEGMRTEEELKALCANLKKKT